MFFKLGNVILVCGKYVIILSKHLNNNKVLIIKGEKD